MIPRLMRCLVLFVLLVATSPVGAETWKIASMEGFAPYNYESDGAVVGIDVDILNEATAALGITIDHRPMPWRRALLSFDTDPSFDALFQLAPTEERFGKWLMVGPLRHTRTVVGTLVDSPIVDVSSLDDLRDLKVGIVANFTYYPEFDAADYLDKEESPDDFANMRKLLIGRVDVVVGGLASLNYVKRELNAHQKIRFLPNPLTVGERYIAFNRSADGAYKAKRLQEVLDTMHRTGRIQHIIERHLHR